ncbi:hypothetical protein WJX74_006973 [Apatococcus lobatus]|uniref:Uncharacterized protein n=1 Tax=Apatococcus lobatus TaxID=904363 RepID=A0AAW1RSA6_9CHLO
MRRVPESQTQITFDHFDLLRESGSSRPKQLDPLSARLPTKTVADVLADSQRLLQQHLPANVKPAEYCDAEAEDQLYTGGPLEQFILSTRRPPPNTRSFCATPQHAELSAVASSRTPVQSTQGPPAQAARQAAHGPAAQQPLLDERGGADAAWGVWKGRFPFQPAQGSQQQQQQQQDPCALLAAAAVSRATAGEATHPQETLISGSNQDWMQAAWEGFLSASSPVYSQSQEGKKRGRSCHQQHRNHPEEPQLPSAKALKRELTLACDRDSRTEELANTLQLLFVNDVDIRHDCRRALFSVATAWTDTLELPKTDRSVAKVGVLSWQHGWIDASRPASIIQDVWHAIICSDANTDMKFESMLPGMVGSPLCLQQLVQDPVSVFMSRLRVYAIHVAAQLDLANHDPRSAAAGRACELAVELLATTLAKTGRVPMKCLSSQDFVALPHDSRTRLKQKHFVKVAAAMGLSWHQKFMLLSKREVYWVALGRVLWQRKQLIAALQAAALQMEEQIEAEPCMWLNQPGPLRTQVISILEQLRQSMESQKYLARNFSYQMILEVLSPYQWAILVGRSLPYHVDTMASVEAIAAEQGSPPLSELLARHHSLPVHFSPLQSLSRPGPALEGSQWLGAGARV